MSIAIPSALVLPAHVKAAVVRVEPQAEVFLFGSRVRGDAQADSDWDFLVLLDGDVNEMRRTAIIAALMPLELAAAQPIIPIIRAKTAWGATPLQRAMPFYQTVSREAQLL